MGTHNQNVVPGSGNTYDLGTASARWKDIFLRHGARLYDASASIWELAPEGLTRDEFSGTATLTPADVGNPDVVQVTLPRYIECDFVVLVCGAMGSVTKGDPAVTYDVYPYWHGPIYVCSPVSSGFQAHVTWDVFYRSDNRPVRPSNGAKGPWSNLNQLCNDMDDWSLDDIPTGTKTLYWIARWPLP